MNAPRVAAFAFASLGALALLALSLGGAGASPASSGCAMSVHLTSSTPVAQTGQMVTLHTSVLFSGTACHSRLATFSYANLPTVIGGASGPQLTFPATEIGVYNPTVTVTGAYGEGTSSVLLMVTPIQN